MKFAYLVAALIAVSPAAFAQGVSDQAPGQQEKGTHNTPGASYNAPGQEKLRDAPNPNPGSPGASGYAPGHSSPTTGSATKDRDDMTKNKNR